MSCESNSLFMNIKEEISSDKEDEGTQNLCLDQSSQTSPSSSVRSNVKIQVLSYKDIPDLKAEPDSENEDFNYYENISDATNGSLNLRSYESLDQIVKIKEENEFEFRIVELNSLNDDYEDYCQLDSVVEFEDEQKTTFRIDSLQIFENYSNQESSDTQNDYPDQFLTNLGSNQVTKIKRNPKLCRQVLNKTTSRITLKNQDCSNFSIKQEINDDEHQLIDTIIHTSSDKLSNTNTASLKLEDHPKVFTENFLQKQIIQETLKVFRKKMKFSEVCYRKFANLSKILQRPSLNEKFLSRILLKNPSNSPPKEISNKVHLISKSIRLDKDDIAELPIKVMESLMLKKHSVNFEIREGQVINMFNIPYYICTSCSTVFVTQNIFFMHYKILHATLEKPFECWKCVTSYCSWKALLVHLKCHDQNRQFLCNYCFFPFKLRDTLEKHIKNVHVEKVEKISCEICGRRFDNERAMLTHKNRHAQVTRIKEINCSQTVQRSNSIKCIFCPAQFFKNGALEEHYKTHKALERMKCRGCGKDVMVNPQYIIKNIKMREFKCIKCVTPMSNVHSSLDIGKSVIITDGQIKIENNSEKEIICETSTSKNVQRVKLKAHEPKKMTTMNVNQESNKLSVKCYVCGIDVGSNIKLFWHMKGHLEKHQFKCSVCREDFNSRESMIEHSRTKHSTTNIIKCKTCNKQFHFVDLETHMKTHLDNIEICTSQTISKSPKMIKIDSKVGQKSPKNSSQLRKDPKLIKQEDLCVKDKEILVKSNPNEKAMLFGAICPTCRKYVLNKDMTIHSQKHDQERTSKLVQNIQNRRKQDELLDRIKHLRKDGKTFKGTKIILKRKTEENADTVEKRAKLEDFT